MKAAGQAEDNTASRPPNTVTLTVLKQTMVWERYLNQFQYLCETLVPQNLGRDCSESPAGQTFVIWSISVMIKLLD